MSDTVRLAMIGLGNVGRAFLDLLGSKAGKLWDDFGLRLIVTGVADSQGAVIDEHGLDYAALRAHKGAGRPVAEYPGGVSGMSAVEMVNQVPADILLESAAVNLENGQPGLDCTRAALRRGWGAVLADKG